MTFSIIVPYFTEDEKTIAECKQSVCDAISEFGIPEKVEIIEEYGGDGVGVARNRGIARSKGEWLLFVDADDLIKPNWLVSINSAIVDNPDADIIAFGDVKGVELYRGLWNKAYRRSVLPEGGFGPYTHGEDRLFLLKAILKAKKIVKLPVDLYVYRPTALSVTSKTRDLKWIKDTLGYSAEMITAMHGHDLPVRLYHDIAVWTLEECSWAMLTLPFDCKNQAINLWRDFLPRIIHCRNMSVWYRFVAKMCLTFGASTQFALCICPRRIKRMLSRL